MFCPYRYIGNCVVGETAPEEATCLEKDCALWNVSTGTCGLVTEAFILGIQVEREDAKKEVY